MVRLLIIVGLLAFGVGGLWHEGYFEVWSPEIKPPSSEANAVDNVDTVAYEHAVLGVGFLYPSAWGDVVETEVESGNFHLAFSALVSGEAPGRPAPFLAYRTDTYKAVPRGGYWGDMTTASSTDCALYEGTNCIVNEGTGGLVSLVLRTPVQYCEAEGVVDTLVYVVPLSVTGLAPNIVLSDDAVANQEDCFVRDEEKADAFAQLVDSLYRLPL